MALNENLQLPDLLAPIPGESPVGPDLKYSNEFSEIEWAYNQGQDAVPPTTPPGFPGAEAEEHFSRVLELGQEFLSTQSKDLRVASFLAGALLRVGKGEDEDAPGALCFYGLAFGLELLRGILDQYWDDLHSSVPARAAILGVLGSDAITIPVRMVPLTEWGHTYFHYKDWSRDAIPDQGPPDEDTLWAGNFEKGLADTGREYYESLTGALEACLDQMGGLDALCKEKFGEAEEPPPRFADLNQSLQQLSGAATQLLEKKAPPPPPPPPEPAPQEEPPGDAAPATVEPTARAAAPASAPGADGGQGSQVEAPPAPPPAAPSPPAAPPGGPDQALAAVASAAKVLREADPTSPVAYLLVRGLRWGEIRKGPGGIEPQLLEPPTSEDRRRLRGLFLEEKWEELLSASEEVMSSEAGRGWLDLQRYSILAADKLGKEYGPVARALRGALKTVLEDLPALAAATLMDDSSSASSDTSTWLEAAGFIQSGREEESPGESEDDTDPEQARREGSFERARHLVQGGDPDGAIRLLMHRADREESNRSKFITRAEAAAIMVSRGEMPVARPILDQLLKEVDEHNLEDWEAGSVVARPLGLLYRCLDAGEAPLRQQIYQRICRLDPLLGRSLGDADRG